MTLHQLAIRIDNDGTLVVIARPLGRELLIPYVRYPGGTKVIDCGGGEEMLAAKTMVRRWYLEKVLETPKGNYDVYVETEPHIDP